MGYGRRYLRESELQMAAPLRTDPIEHQVTSSWPTRSANGNVALRGIDRLSSLRPPRWPLTEYTFSWKPHRLDLLAIGIFWMLAIMSGSYAMYALRVASPGAVPFPAAIASLGEESGPATGGLIGTYLILLFPNGRLPSGDGAR